MIPRTFLSVVLMLTAALVAQQPPYDIFPAADPPYFRVRYEASTEPGQLAYPVNYTIWIPPGVKALRGVVVHQHGCGEGSCKSGLTGAYDLHWQALARKHDCALLAPSYEQPEKADCQLWCDPRNGSSAAFRKCLADLGAKSGHPELAEVPWALWGHSGGGHWAGGMVLMHPERVAAAWLRSGVPLLEPDPNRATIKAHTLVDGALKVPLMCNLGTKEGVSITDGRFAGVWPANQAFFDAVRGKGGLIGVAVDPLTSHECGNQRYLAIPWLDACLTARLPKAGKGPLREMPEDAAWLAPLGGLEAVPAASFAGERLKAVWLPSEAIAQAWKQYVKDTAVTDTTPPPAPTEVHVKGNELSWQCEADLESGLAEFVIERDGQLLAKVPEQAKNAFGRPIFQNLQYSDTPTQPLAPMHYVDTKAEPGKQHAYRVTAVNTVGLQSKLSAAAKVAASRPPNVIFILADDLGYADLGCFGATDIRTPNLDRLAEQGTRFTNYYVAQPVCTASRAALMSGCYPNRIGLAGALNHTSKNGIHPDEWLLPEMLKERGYATICIGKWHLGTVPSLRATRHGFDEWLGIPYSNDNSKYHPVMAAEMPPLPLNDGDAVVELDPDQSQFTRRFTERAVSFIERNASRRFFVYLPHVMPHVPIFASEKFKGQSRRGLYGDVVQELDWSVGQVLATLERLKLAEDTLVIFSSDNGPWLSYGEHAGSAGPLREGKLTAFEGGVRVPMLCRWPGHVPAGRVNDEPWMAIDWLPTLTELVNGRKPERKTDGSSVKGLLLGENGAKGPHEALFFYAGDELHAVRSGEWKLHLPHPYLTTAGEPGRGGKPSNWGKATPRSIQDSSMDAIASRHGQRVERMELSLFNLRTDPGEKENVAPKQPEIVARLSRLADVVRAELGDSLTGAKGTGRRAAGFEPAAAP